MTTIGKCLIVIAGLCVMVQAGCNGEVTIKPEYAGLPGQKVAVVIVADEAMLFEHKFLRRQIASVVNYEFSKRMKTVETILPQRITRYQDAHLDWAKETTASLGERFGADYVMMITVRNFRLLEPGSTRLYRGNLAASVELVKTVSGENVWSAALIEDSFPRRGEKVENMVGGLAAIRLKVQRRFAERLVQNFYPRKERGNK